MDDSTKEKCWRVKGKTSVTSIFIIIYVFLFFLIFDIHNHLGSCLYSSHETHFLFIIIFTSSAMLSLDPKHHKKFNKLKPNNLPWFHKKKRLPLIIGNWREESRELWKDERTAKEWWLHKQLIVFDFKVLNMSVHKRNPFSKAVKQMMKNDCWTIDVS